MKVQLKWQLSGESREFKEVDYSFLPARLKDHTQPIMFMQKSLFRLPDYNRLTGKEQRRLIRSNYNGYTERCFSKSFQMFIATKLHTHMLKVSPILKNAGFVTLEGGKSSSL